MNSLGSRARRSVEDSVENEVTFRSGPGSDQVGLVRRGDVERVAVCLGVDGNSGDAELVKRAEDADRDLAAICDENFSERSHGQGVFSIE